MTLCIFLKSNFSPVHGAILAISFFLLFWHEWRAKTSPTLRTKTTGRKTNNVGRDAHIAYCIEGKRRVFQQIGHEIERTKKWPNVYPIFPADRSKQKCASFPHLRGNKRLENTKVCYVAQGEIKATVHISCSFIFPSVRFEDGEGTWGGEENAYFPLEVH